MSSRSAGTCSIGSDACRKDARRSRCGRTASRSWVHGSDSLDSGNAEAGNLRGDAGGARYVRVDHWSQRCERSSDRARKARILFVDWRFAMVPMPAMLRARATRVGPRWDARLASIFPYQRTNAGQPNARGQTRSLGSGTCRSQKRNSRALLPESSIRQAQRQSELMRRLQPRTRLISIRESHGARIQSQPVGRAQSLVRV